MSDETDKINLSLGVAVGSSIQIALFVIPVMVSLPWPSFTTTSTDSFSNAQVILAWCLGKPLLMLFDPFGTWPFDMACLDADSDPLASTESVILFLSVLLVNTTLADGRVNFLEGIVLICVYIMIAVAVY